MIGCHCSKTYIFQTLRDQSSIVIPQNLGIEDPSANVGFTWVQLKVWSRAAFPVEWRRITLAMLQDPRGPCSKVATPNGCSSATTWQYKSAQKAIPNFFLWMLLDPNHSSQNPTCSYLPSTSQQPQHQQHRRTIASVAAPASRASCSASTASCTEWTAPNRSLGIDFFW